jgi:hypothetical protein
VARKIAVEGEPESITKNAAKYLIRTLAAEWLIRGVSIRRRSAREIPIGAQFTRRMKASPYIPEKLPLAELPGVIFEPPISRNARLLPVLPDLPHFCD